LSKETVSFLKCILFFKFLCNIYLRSPGISLWKIMQFIIYHWGIENDCTHLAEIKRARKNHFIPRGRTRGIGLRGFLIKSDTRRSVSNGNMHVRPRDFAGGVRPAPFVKRGCDSITMEFIHPSIYPVARRWARYDSEREWQRKEIFFIPPFPSASLDLYRNQEDTERISNSVSHEICRAWTVRGEFSARAPVHLSWHPVNILKYSITYPKILSLCFHGIF